MDSYYRLRYAHFSLYCEGECQIVGNHRVVTQAHMAQLYKSQLMHACIPLSSFCDNKTEGICSSFL